MPKTPPPLGDDQIRTLYADTLRMRATCHERLGCGGKPAVEPRSLERALPALVAEKRSKLPLVFLAAMAGYADLLSKDAEDAQLRERMIAVCGLLDRNLDASLTNLLFGTSAKRKNRAGRR